MVSLRSNSSDKFVRQIDENDITRNKLHCIALYCNCLGLTCRTQDLRNNLACQLLLSLERKTNPEISRACCFCRKAWKSLHIEPSAARCVQGWRCEWPKLNFKDSYLSVQGWRRTIHATPCCLDEFDQSRKVLAAVSEARRAP